MPSQRAMGLGALAVLGAVYLFGVIPFTFFRHDDWWILGNVLKHLPLDISFLWSPTLYHGEQPVVWFFRPGFKAIVYAFYQFFGLHYGAWVAATLLLFLTTLWVGFLTVEKIGNRRSGLWFLLVAAVSFPIHFGSVAWMGEGLMNIPQGFLLMVNTYALCCAFLDRSRFWVALAYASFVLALGFKESSLFHLAFIIPMVLTEPKFQATSQSFRVKVLAGLSSLGAIYLVFRLGAMPLNPSYLPRYTLESIGRTSAIALGAIGLGGLSWVVYLRLLHRVEARSYWVGFKARVVYLPFLLVSLSMYLGHDFFSPGWLYLPGLFVLLGLAFNPLPEFCDSANLGRFAFLLSALSLTPVGLRLNEIGWTHWSAMQREVFEEVRSLPLSVEALRIRTCETAEYPGVTLERVVGNEESIRQMAFVLHQREIEINIEHCKRQRPFKEGERVFEVAFPSQSRITALSHK